MNMGNRTIAIASWVVFIVLLLIGLIHPPIPNGSTPSSPGWLSAGLFSWGVLSAGLFSAGIFSAGLFSVGIVSVRVFSLGVFSMGTFAFGIFVTRQYLEARKELSDINSFSAVSANGASTG